MSARLFLQEGYYNWLKEGVRQGDEAVQTQFLLDVGEYARLAFPSWMSPVDREDATSEIQCAVLTSLPNFLRGSDDRTPQARQAWLKGIVHNTLCDYLDSQRFGPSFRTWKKYQEEDRATPELLSLDDAGEERLQGELTASLEESLVGEDSSDLLNQIVADVGTLRTDAAGLLGFLYHNVVFLLEHGNTKKGYPEETCRRLRGKTLGQLRDALPVALLRASGYVVSGESFAGLDQKLDGRRQEVWNLSPDKISDLSSYIKKRLCQLKR